MNGEGIFRGRDRPDHKTVWELYEQGRSFNEQLDLYDNVRVNENFFIGKQWEGIRDNGLPAPVFNLLKRDVNFVVATITSDNLKVQASPLAATPNTEELRDPARVLSEEFEAIFSRNHITNLVREFVRDAAVRGDGCIYTWWEPDMETGQPAKGGIRSETVENTRVYFGDPNERRVQEQPYIIIESHDTLRKARKEARENGCQGWEDIAPDGELQGSTDQVKNMGDKVTKLLVLWKDDRTGEVWGYKCTRSGDVKEPWSLGIRLYPVVWLCWDYIQESYHGQAMISGLIPNQIFINKMWAMSQLSLMTSAYPKVVYNRTSIPKWTNRIGEAIAVANLSPGQDIGSVAKVIEPAQISPQVAQFINLATDQTNANLGATSAALGDARPDNTSAILALQRAASTPHELTKQNLYQCVEELARIYLEFIAACYGTRIVDVTPTAEVMESYRFAGLETPKEVPVQFDFSMLRELPMSMKLEVGASAYYSEIAAMQTLDNLLLSGAITPVQYLERLPDGYVPDRSGLIMEMKGQLQQTQGSAGPPGGKITEPVEDTGMASLRDKVFGRGK